MPSKKLKTEEVDLESLLKNSPLAFDKIADAILNKYHLIIKPKKSEPVKYRICEIEFYLNDQDTHRDTFTHGDPI